LLRTAVFVLEKGARDREQAFVLEDCFGWFAVFLEIPMYRVIIRAKNARREV